jgi:antitoxin component YwqK of YwqJK toxin-antitoxin module
MVHQAQLLNKLFIVCCIIFIGCKNPANEQSIHETTQPSLLVNQLDSSFINQNGIILWHEKPFTGRIFALYPSSADTAATQEFINGLENGEWKKWYPGHQIKEIRFFDNGKKVGVYTIYWENGNKQLEYHFVNDEYEGLCREWNEAGNLTRGMNYVKGHEEGSQKWWYDNGKIKANYVIINGRRFGLLGTKNCINVSDSIFKK